MKVPIGKLERVQLREVWRHEAYDFTQWLQENIDVLNDITGLSLVSVDRERPAGSFNVDLVATDEGGGTVIIENQLEKSNHDHLGKLITYLTAMSAKAAVWIVSEPRPEHVAAMTWLNDTGSATFYMVKAEAVKIGDSAPAPLLTVIVAPSEDAKEVGQAKREITERNSVFKRWWTQLIALSAGVSRLHSHLSPREYSWLGTSSGIPGLSLNYTVGKADCGAELYIDRGKNSEAENEAIFDQLEAKKAEIEAAFNGPLNWERLSSRRACRIRTIQREGGYQSPEESWPEIQSHIIDAMVRLEKALRPYMQPYRA